ncbi:MAG: NH(3)-dependent NAD(+) synthetase [candidate division WS2 bacterium]|nr:NH(3)-dependent NAD(+) synthetase [Candidatus Lithacetigena glycinireducens]
MINLNCEFAEKLLVNFILDQKEKTGAESMVFGLSGGLDSTVSAYLLKEALGKNILALILPYGDWTKNDMEDALMVAKELNLNYEIYSLDKLALGYFEDMQVEDRLRQGNFVSRLRSNVVFDFSKKLKAIVAGSSNKTELLMGYGTWYGDLAASFYLLGDLYKTQVRLLAKYLGVPDRILSKVPTAGLWPGQTDEGEMGITYEELDKILYLLVDKRKTVEEVISEGFADKNVRRVAQQVFASAFKRKIPTIPKLSQRTIGADFLYLKEYRPKDSKTE